jgi:hypothetical protein
MPTSDDERKLILKAYCELGQIERGHSRHWLRPASYPSEPRKFTRLQLRGRVPCSSRQRAANPVAVMVETPFGPSEFPTPGF